MGSSAGMAGLTHEPTVKGHLSWACLGWDHLSPCCGSWVGLVILVSPLSGQHGLILRMPQGSERESSGDKGGAGEVAQLLRAPSW